MINRQTLPCFISKSHENLNTEDIIALALVNEAQFETWLRQQDEFTMNWLMHNNYKIKAHSFCLIPNKKGKIAKVLVGMAEELDCWSLAHLPMQLPVGFYALEDSKQWETLALGWGLAAYHFSAFKKAEREAATLVIPDDHDPHKVQSQLQAIYLVRDLINTPAENMGPEELSFATKTLAAHYQAEFSEIIGEDLLKENYPAIYIVGRGSARMPRLLDLQWGDVSHPKLTLVGKGVCFDTGGYDLKTSQGMSNMKKDMGGAAHVLGLASLIMDANLPVRLRVLIPAVENSVSGSSYRPGDVISTRKGLTVEIGNTDAEGRVVLADALAEASSQKPDLIIDFATLTGAARVALGTQIPVMFANDDAQMKKMQSASYAEKELLWPLPLHQDYKELIDSPIADINNAADTGYGGAITAGLFLQEFVDNAIAWFHFDLMAWNVKDKPGRPKGGEAMGLRAVFAYLQRRYGA